MRQRSEARLSESLALLDARRRRLASLSEDLACAEQRWGALLRESITDGVSIRESARCLEAARQAVTTARSAEREALEAVESAQHDLVEKAREHRVLERLRETRKRRWLADGEREDQRFLDELHLLTSSRTKARRHEDA